MRRDGFAVLPFLRRNAARYVLVLAAGAAGIAAYAFLQQETMCWIVLGALAGALLRDIGWLRNVRKSWPFTVRVTDWDEVQRIADEEPAA